jgi:DedD protein
MQGNHVMAERSAVDPVMDELRRKARRRLVGAIVLALAAAVVLPMLLEKEPRTLGEDVAVRIPPVDDGKFVNKLSPAATAAPDAKAAAPAASPAPSAPPGGAPTSDATPAAAAPATAAAAAQPAVVQAEQRVMAGGRTPVDTKAAEATFAQAAGVTPTAATTSAPATATPAPAPAAAVMPPVAAAGTSPEAAAEPAKVASVEPRAASATDAAAKSAAADAAYVVQLAAFADDKGANALASKLKRNGYPAFTEPVHTTKGTLYRVRVGTYPSRDAAGDARNKLKADGYSGIVAAAH